jgi:Chaperone of endosialidase
MPQGINRVQNLTVGFAGLVLMLWVRLSWGQAPPNNDVSDLRHNTAGGSGALSSNTTGSGNTAFGFDALQSNDTGSFNTTSGLNALRRNSTGSDNTASGAEALEFNTTGSGNTATGSQALRGNTTGSNNTASGDVALQFNRAGFNNTASGVAALRANRDGSNNTASGVDALRNNEDGSFNTAYGNATLRDNSTGSGNTASGVVALRDNTTGSDNTAVGFQALQSNTAGDRNTALGHGAGILLTSGSDNIYIRNDGAVSESNTIRLGSPGEQTRTFIAGVFSVPVSGQAVRINSEGQLGVQASSARYKRDIQRMGAHSQGLLQLRPVTFRYKQDRQGEQQYGLIAEEVAEVYPELVTRGASGEIEAVRYEELIPMLLNELQHQQEKLGVQARQLAELKAQNESLRVALLQQNAELAAHLARLEEAVRAAPRASR